MLGMLQGRDRGYGDTSSQKHNIPVLLRQSLFRARVYESGRLATTNTDYEESFLRI